MSQSHAHDKEDRYWAKRRKTAERLLDLLDGLQEYAESTGKHGVSVKRLSLVWKDLDFNPVLAVLTVDRGGESEVAFHRGDEYAPVLAKVISGLLDGKLEWKEDGYAKRDD